MSLMMPEKEVRIKIEDEEKQQNGSMSNGHMSQLENSPITKAGAVCVTN